MPAGTGSSVIAITKVAGYATICGIFNFLHIPQEGVFILATLMAIDFITGVGKQLRLNPHKLTSHVAWLGLSKKIIIFLLLISLALAFSYLNLNPEKIIDTSLGILIMSELYSIIQNSYAVLTGVVLPEYDVISIFLKSLGDFIKDRLDKMTKIQIVIDGEPKTSEPQTETK